jgi:prolyl oligopeptidase
MLLASPNGSQMVLYKIFCGDPQTTDLYIQNLASGASPQLVVKQVVGRFCAFFFRNQLIALTDWKSPKGRIVAIDSDRPQPSNWVEVVPESGVCVRGVAVSDERIFVGYMEDAVTRIEIFDPCGRRCGAIPCPPNGTADLLQGDPNGDAVFYSFTSFSQPPSTYCYHSKTGRQDIWTRDKVPFDGSEVEVEQVRYASKDGTQIPMFLVCQKGRGHSGPSPIFLTGYGGFGSSITPRFTAYATFLMEQGFLFAVANLRGGSEFGEEWHLAGKRHNRQNAFDDFIAAAEWLLARGRAAPGRIAIGGGSNAGLLVGAALTQRPDLFRAVVCLGPLSDMLRYHKFDRGNLWIEEFGCAENESDFRHLQVYSPYHRAEDGVAYPAVMLISGDADTRCNPMHARKMAARLQAATGSGHPILLDYKPTWGHTPVQPLSNRIEALSDRLAFICHELGVSV